MIIGGGSSKLQFSVMNKLSKLVLVIHRSKLSDTSLFPWLRRIRSGCPMGGRSVSVRKIPESAELHLSPPLLLYHRLFSTFMGGRSVSVRKILESADIASPPSFFRREDMRPWNFRRRESRSRSMTQKK